MTAAAPLADAELPASARLVVIVGNPNVGKTTLFNRLTGQNARVGNYPGVTVERRSGLLRSAGRRQTQPAVELVDVPGTYSLSARSGEEQIAIASALGLAGYPRPALAVVVVDAGQLQRNLYLVLQLVELQVPLVIALNMIDEVEANPPDAQAISELFRVPVVATNARTGAGLDELEREIRNGLTDPRIGRIRVAYPEALRRDMDRVAEALPRDWRVNVERDRALAAWALLSLDEQDELHDIPLGLRERCTDVLRDAGTRDLDQELIGARYAALDQYAPRLYRTADLHPPKRAVSERVDRVLLHPVFGFTIFIALMLVMFQALFSWADPAITAIEELFSLLQRGLAALLPAGVVLDLLSEGVVGGVGNVIVFLPQILLLFLFVGLLEDSGYMARIAYLMDRIMRSLGLHGRAFVPMLSGFACAVPAILATRTMERKRDRLLTMMVIPLMTCSARLPVYTLIIGALFPPTLVFGWLPVQGLLMVGMYLFSIVMTLAAAAVLGRTVVQGRRVPLILELPPYRAPALRSILKMMWERAAVFLKEAGTIILVCTVVLWALLSYPRLPTGDGANSTTAPANVSAIEYSYGGRIGKAIEPALEPLGFDWKIGVGMIGAFAAREVFVSTLGLVYGIGDDDGVEEPLRDKLRAETRADGAPAYRPLTALSLLVFFALACQCMSTLAVVRRETRSWRWPVFMFAYMTALAYAMSLLVFQVGSHLGY